MSLVLNCVVTLVLPSWGLELRSGYSLRPGSASPFDYPLSNYRSSTRLSSSQRSSSLAYPPRLSTSRPVFSTIFSTIFTTIFTTMASSILQFFSNRPGIGRPPIKYVRGFKLSLASRIFLIDPLWIIQTDLNSHWPTSHELALHLNALVSAIRLDPLLVQSAGQLLARFIILTTSSMLLSW
ncbi:hypothetical protein PGTUg99_021862 [Puccinia graminis f. sp. tritici]|uniref:Uncharacterized protein n=1 Tax=Puccinia graminis f. sp. tritici TaxID=56615 RepID=A0A5B0MQD1_PUCGR|nr:hypothetical protein PGTUg99_021862 [Puccinia graminis f. sp. tritici]